MVSRFSSAFGRDPRFDNLTPEQLAALEAALSPDRFSRYPQRRPQEMTPVRPNLRDRAEMLTGDVFGRQGSRNAMDVLDLVDPGVLTLSDANRAFGEGRFIEGSILGGAGLLGAVPIIGKPIQRAGRAFGTAKANTAADLLRGRDVQVNPDIFSDTAQFSKYRTQFEAPAARRREAMRLTALEEAGPAQFGRGGFSLGEIGTEGLIRPVQRQIVRPEDFQGRMIVPTFGDTSDMRMLTRVGGVPLSRPVEAQGGLNFPQLEGGFASNRSAAANLFNAAMMAGDADPVPLGVTVTMGPEAINFTNATAEAMIRQLPAIGIPKSVKENFDRTIRNLEVKTDGKVTKPYRDFVGLDSPALEDQLFGRNEFAGQSGDLRKAVIAEMSKASRAQQGFPVYSDVFSAVSRRELANLPRGSAGYSAFGFDLDRGLVPEPFHNTYDTRITDTGYEGGFVAPVPLRTMMPKTFAELDQMRTKRGKPLTEAQKLGALQMGQYSEVFDQQAVDATSAAIAAAEPFNPTVPQEFRFPQESPFGRGRSYRATGEEIPGAGTGYLEGITSMPEADRIQYSEQASWTDRFGRDQLYAAQGLPVEQSVFGRGAYTPSDDLPTEFNPMTVANPVTTDVGQVRATEAVRAYVDAQNAGAAHRIIPLTETKPAERVDLELDVTGISLTPDQFREVERIAGENGYFPIDSGDRVVLVNYSPERPAAMLENSNLGQQDRRAMQNAIRAVVPNVNVTRAKVETDIYVDYQKAFEESKQGQGLVTEKLAEELTGREDLIAAVDPVVRRKAQLNLDRDLEFARDNKLPLRSDRIRALEIMARDGIRGVLQAAKSGEILPAIAGAILAPSFLGFEEKE